MKNLEGNGAGAENRSFFLFQCQEFFENMAVLLMIGNKILIFKILWRNLFCFLNTILFEYIPSYRIEKQTDSSSWIALEYADTFPGYQEIEVQSFILRD